MAGYITTAHDIAQRLSEKWRHCACTSDIINFCTSLFCVGVQGPEGDGAVYLSFMSVLSQVFLVLSQSFLGFISGFSPR